MTPPPSTLEALVDALGEDALNAEISWQAADRALTLVEESAARRELVAEHQEWLEYAERIRQLAPNSLDDDELWREFNLARAHWLEGHQIGWLEDWQRRLQSELRERQSQPA